MKKLLFFYAISVVLCLPVGATEPVVGTEPSIGTEPVVEPGPVLRPADLSIETAPVLRPASVSLENQPAPLAQTLDEDSLVFYRYSREAALSAVEFQQSSDFTVRMQILVDLRKIYIDDDTGGTNEVDFRGSDLSLSVDWQDKVRVFLKANLSHLFEYRNNNKVDFNENFQLEDFIDNAYIELREIDDTPYAVVIGKRDLVLGLHDIATAVPIPYTFWENYQTRWDVIAITVKYGEQVELTVYEGAYGDKGDNFNEGQGDFDIEEGSLGFLLRVTRDLTPNVDFVAAYNKQKNEYIGYEDPEEKVIAGFQVEVNSRVNSWIEAIYLIKKPPLNISYGDGKWGTSIGLSYALSDDVSFVGNYNHIDNLTRELGLGLVMNCPFCSNRLKDRSQLKFQIYHSEYPELGWEQDTLFGVSWVIVLDQVFYGN